MQSTKQSPYSSPYHQPLLRDPPQHDPPYVVLVSYHPPGRPLLGRGCPTRHLLSCLILLPLLAAAAFILWPSDPDLSIVRLRLDRLHFHSSPKFDIDVTLHVTLKVRNKDFFSLDYDSSNVSIGYRGNQLGYATSHGGRVKARGSSYVNATLVLDGVEVLSDVILLLEDLAKGAIPFDTVSEISGELGLFFFKVPIKAKVSCEVIVNASNQTVVHQNCYPE